MSDAHSPALRYPRTTVPRPVRSHAPAPAPETGTVLCERCAGEMFRMHAVWRCPGCGFKTDCCGW